MPLQLCTFQYIWCTCLQGYSIHSYSSGLSFIITEFPAQGSVNKDINKAMN